MSVFTDPAVIAALVALVLAYGYLGALLWARWYLRRRRAIDC